MIIYDITSGDIVAIVPNDQTIETFFFHYPQEYKDKLKALYTDIENPLLSNEFRVINGIITRKPEQEIQEVRTYGKVLTEEERVTEMLRPSYAEVQKAENTIEILELLQEVLS